MGKIKWLIFTATIVGFFAFIISSSNQASINLEDININIAQIANSDNGGIADHIKGNPESKVALIEYADYQCPGCATTNPIMKLFVDEYKDKIAFIFRNYPITSIHKNAKSSAAAVEAAGLQNKYWEMHDLIFETQSNWQYLDIEKRTEFYISQAKKLGLDADKFKKDMSSADVDKKIKYDQAMARQSKLEATPSFILNGKLIDDEVWSDSEKFKKLINDELIKNNIEPPLVEE